MTGPAGIRFRHENGAAGDKWYPEPFAGSGFDAAGVHGLDAAVADFDNDGRDDV